MAKMNKAKIKRVHNSRVSWHSVDYWLLNGFLLPGRAYSALSDLVRAGRFKSLDTAILEGVRAIVEENASLLVRTDSKWLHMLNGMKMVSKDPRHAKPDAAGEENLGFLNEMYKAMDEAESET